MNAANLLQQPTILEHSQISFFSSQAVVTYNLVLQQIQGTYIFEQYAYML